MEQDDDAGAYLLGGQPRTSAEAAHSIRMNVMILAFGLYFGSGIFFSVFTAYTSHVLKVSDPVMAGVYGVVAYHAGVVVSNPIWGKVSDSVGRKPVLLVGVAAVFLAMLGLAGNSSRMGFIILLSFVGVFDSAGAMWHLMLVDTQEAPLQWPWTLFESSDDHEGRVAAMFALMWCISASGALVGLCCSFFLADSIGIRATLLVAAVLIAAAWLRVFFDMPESLAESKGKGVRYFLEVLGDAYRDLKRGMSYLLATPHRRLILLVGALQSAAAATTFLLIGYWVAYKFGFGIVMRGVLLIIGISSIAGLMCWLRFSLVPFFRSAETACAFLIAATVPLWLILGFAFTFFMAPLGATAIGAVAIFPDTRALVTVEVPVQEQGYLQGTWGAVTSLGYCAGALASLYIYESSTEPHISHDSTRTHDSIRANSIWHFVAALEVIVAALFLEAQRARQNEELDKVTDHLAKESERDNSQKTPTPTSMMGNSSTTPSMLL